MCRVLGVSPSGYYAWAQAAAFGAQPADAALTERIASDSRGLPRDLWSSARPLRAWRGGNPSRPQAGGSSDEGGRASGSEPSQGFSHDGALSGGVPGAGSGRARLHGATGPNRLWVADITYIPTWAGFLFLAVCSGRLEPEGRGLGDGHASDGPSSCSTHSTWPSRSGSREMSIHHSDHGRSTPRSPSASDAGKPACARRWDPSATATTMRCARASSRRSSASCSTDASFQTQAEARMAVFEFIEGLYNPRRRHSALGYLSPINYERNLALREVPESAQLSTESG